MRRNLDNIEIVEPPIEELTKKYSRSSGCRRGCLTGCVVIVLLIVGIIIFVRLAMGEGPQTLKKAPENFPKDIPVYDPDNIDRITFISGKYKNRGIEIAAFFPKVILSPLLLSMDKGTNENVSGEKTSFDSAKNLWRLIRTPVGDHRDTVQIEWRNMDAEPSFVLSYYRTELKMKGYRIEVESQGTGVRQFSFSQSGGASGSFYVQGNEEERPGTDYAILTVNLPLNNTNPGAPLVPRK